MQSNSKTYKKSNSPNETYFPVGDVKPAPELTINAVDYNLELIGSPALNAMGLLGNTIKIGIIDSGCVQGVFAYKNFTNEKDADLNGHGSHVTSIILKIAPGVTIYMAKAMGSDGGGSIKAVIAATKWLKEQGVNIVNCSFGFNPGANITDYVKLIDECAEAGMVFCCASGNEGASSVLFPSNRENVFCVGAVDKDSKLTSFSNKGVDVDLVAPGKDIVGVGLSGIMLMSGTSQATPHVSAMLALYMEHTGVKNFWDAYSYITKNSVKDLGDGGMDSSYGHGLIKPYFAGIQDPPAKKRGGWLARLWRHLFG